jgi:GNAT superfamily N-acetyltransferase
MTSPYIDPTLIFAWQTAHSVARGSPLPVHDRGGFRVDTHSEKELKRWVFPQRCDGLRAIAHDITVPRHYLKLCGTSEELREELPAHWAVQEENYFMTATGNALDEKPLPDGYRMELHREGPVTRACVVAPDGDLAASGCAAEAADVFIYDRIETAQDHRRKGLGIAVMIALESARKSRSSPQLLVATVAGRGLYASLGWTVLAPFATALIPLS